MSSIPTSPRAVLLSCILISTLSVTTLARSLHCHVKNDRPSPSIPDCHIALQMIPSGEVLYQGTNPPSFLLPPTARAPKRAIPAILRARSCMISVQRAGPAPGPTPSHAAHVMYFQVWPAVRAAARDLISSCISSAPRPNAGWTGVEISIEGNEWDFDVFVEGTYPELEDDRRYVDGAGHKVYVQGRFQDKPAHYWHVYDAGGNAPPSGWTATSSWMNMFDIPDSGNKQAH